MTRYIRARQILLEWLENLSALKTWAQELGLNDAARLLDETLAEEKKTDVLLTQIAETAVNQDAEAA